MTASGAVSVCSGAEIDSVFERMSGVMCDVFEVPGLDRPVLAGTMNRSDTVLVVFVACEPRRWPRAWPNAPLLAAGLPAVAPGCPPAAADQRLPAGRCCPPAARTCLPRLHEPGALRQHVLHHGRLDGVRPDRRPARSSAGRCATRRSLRRTCRSASMIPRISSRSALPACTNNGSCSWNRRTDQVAGLHLVGYRWARTASAAWRPAAAALRA